MTQKSVGLRLLERPEEVEASLWRRLRFDNDTSCRQLLFERHLGLARALARREVRRRPAYGLDRSDFDQLAAGGLLEAIDRFDPLKGASFSSFAKHRIRGAIADGAARSSEAGAQYAYRRRAETERLQSLRSNEPGKDSLAELQELAAALAIGLLAEQAASVLHDNGVGHESQRWRELQVEVLEEIDRLPDQERSVIQHHYINGVAFVDVARMLGLSKGRVSQLHGAAIRRVRERLRRVD